MTEMNAKYTDKTLSHTKRLRPIAKGFAMFMLAAVIASGAMFSTSCTQNKGHIGPWFGFWWIDEILIDGQADPNYHCDSYFAFMADNVMVFQATGPGSHTIVRDCIGMWAHKDKTLTLNFDNHDDNHEHYPTPTWIYMSEPRVYTLTIEKYGSEHMRWSWITDQGQTITYILSKTL